MTRRYRYLDTLTIGFVVVLLISNLIGPKICQFGPLRPSAAEFLFPFTYICGDVFTEVYGYGASRRAIWLGFFAMGLLAAMGQLAVALPPAPEWNGPGGLRHRLWPGAALCRRQPRGLLGGRVHQQLHARQAQAAHRRALAVDPDGRLNDHRPGRGYSGSGPGRLWGSPAAAMLLRMMLLLLLIKVAVEVVATPLTYLVVGWLKRAEGVDAFDRRTNFNPFAWQSERA